MNNLVLLLRVWSIVGPFNVIKQTNKYQNWGRISLGLTEARRRRRRLHHRRRDAGFSFALTMHLVLTPLRIFRNSNPWPASHRPIRTILFRRQCRRRLSWQTRLILLLPVFWKSQSTWLGIWSSSTRGVAATREYCAYQVLLLPLWIRRRWPWRIPTMWRTIMRGPCRF